MKERRKYIAYWLLLVCMVMQIASVFPHHHHSELFCLHADLTACAGEDCDTDGMHHEGDLTACAGEDCDTDGMHHEGDGDRHTCSAGCVTHIQSGTPDDAVPHLSPDYSFYLILYTFDTLLHRASECFSRVDAVYVENLHAQDVACATGLRAPPFC